MKHSIGIDFGTTKTMVSYFNPATERVELIRLGRDRDSIPTTVHADESGEYLFGEDADDMIKTDPEGYCRAFKLHLGEAEPVLPRSGETAENLTARFLRHVKEECEQTVFHGGTIDTATITLPVKFSPARRESLKRAAEAAGFASVSFIPEPEAAGTAFLRDNPTDKFSRALVLDWGGGTLDIAIISRDERGVIHADRRCAKGRDDVGGEEMDRLLLVAENGLWKEAFGEPLIQSEEDEPGLLRDTEKVKIGLSRKDSVTFRQGPKKLDVSREQFRQLIDGMLDAAVQLVQTALANNKKQGNPEPDAILLIGGTSLCPVVRDAMEKNFSALRVLAWHHSHEAVALGATASGEGGDKGADSSPESSDKVQDDGNGDELGKAFELAERILRENSGISKLGKKEADIIKQAAQEGDSRAAGILASIYHDGCKGYRKNIAFSFKWAKIAAEAGDDRGQGWLARYYLGIEENNPVRKNRPAALAWAEKAYAGNRSLANKALLMMVLNSFDDPDTARIKRLGNGILKGVGDKAPDQFVLEDQTAIGLSCFLLANLAIQKNEVEKAQNLLQKGVTFGSEDCAEVLSELEQAQEDEDEDDEDWDSDEEDEDEPMQYPRSFPSTRRTSTTTRTSSPSPCSRSASWSSCRSTPPSNVPKNSDGSWEAGAGAVAGAAIGSMITPGIGTIAGGLIGLGIGLIKKSISGK